MTGCKELAENNGDQEWCVCSGPEKVRRRSELTGPLLGLGESWNICVSGRVFNRNIP